MDIKFRTKLYWKNPLTKEWHRTGKNILLKNKVEWEEGLSSMQLFSRITSYLASHDTFERMCKNKKVIIQVTKPFSNQIKNIGKN